MPLFTHDCEECTYCGETVFHPWNAVDVYTHNDTLIARFADDGAGYVSVPYSMADKISRYVELKRFADKTLRKA